MPHKATGKIINEYILILIFLDKCKDRKKLPMVHIKRRMKRTIEAYIMRENIHLQLPTWLFLVEIKFLNTIQYTFGRTYVLFSRDFLFFDSKISARGGIF
jgi:hypothetical protein